MNENLVVDLLTSSTKARTSSLLKIQTYLHSLKNLDQSDLEKTFDNGANEKSFLILLASLLKTYNHFQDLESRNLVLTNLNLIVEVNPSTLTHIIKFINKLEVKNLSIADHLTLLNWINSFIVITTTKNDMNSLVESQSFLVDKILSVPATQKHRRRISNSALTNTRKTLSRLSVTQLELYIGSLFESNIPVHAKLVSVAHLVDATGFEKAKILLKPYVDILVDLLSQYTLLKAVPANYILIQIPNVTSLLCEQQLAVILTSLEKGCLRSPEVCLGGKIMESICSGIHSEKSLLQLISPTKLPELISTGLKNEQWGSNVTKLVQTILNSSVDVDVDLVTKFLNTLCKSPLSTPQKINIADSLSLDYSVEVACCILKVIKPIVIKEGNELVLNALSKSYISQMIYVLKHNSEVLDSKLLKEYTEAIISGLSGKGRKSWYSSLGYALLIVEGNIEKTEYSKSFFELISGQLKTILQSPKLITPHIAISILYKYQSIFNANDLIKIACANFDQSFALKSEQWGVCGLEAIGHLAANDESLSTDDFKEQYGKAWILLLQNSNYEVKMFAKSAFNSLYLKEPYFLSNALLTGLNKISVTEKVEDSIISAFMYTLCQPLQDDELNDSVLRSNVVKSIIFAPDNWVALCQRARVDPGELVSKSYEEIISSAFALLSHPKLNPQTSDLCITALSTIAFIQPELVGPEIAEIIKRDFDLSMVSNLSNEDLTIWKGNEGEIVIDVLQSKPKEHDKNSKDYATAKWEESLRLEIQQKKAAFKKLTREELLLVKEQLTKESHIRASVQSIYDKLTVVIRLINKLSFSLVDTGKSFWFPTAVESLLNLLKNNIILEMSGSLVTECFLNLSNLMPSRMGIIRKFVGLATLRVLDAQYLKAEYLQEPLNDLISRVLFRLKFLSDQLKLNSICLIYICPLLTQVLETGKHFAIKNASKAAVTSEFVEEDKEEEQLLLALEIISTHGENFEDSTVPRSQILRVLLSLMKLPSKAKIAKECFMSLCQNISINISSSDLAIILSNVISPEVFVRNTVLEALDSEFDLSEDLSYSNELWIVVHDNEENNSSLAKTIWEDSKFILPKDAPLQLMNVFGNTDGGLRLSIAKALADAVTQLDGEDGDDVFLSTLDKLTDFYRVKVRPPEPIKDQFGLIVKTSTDQKDTWEERSTIALSLKLLSSSFTSADSIITLFEFLIQEKALGDRESIVRQELQEAGVSIIKSHGARNIESLIPIFEDCLGAKDEGSKTQDYIRESVLILYGALALHLDSSDPRIDQIVDRLIKTLDTPSEDVQYAVSDCVAPLVPMFESRLGGYFDILFEKLFNGKNLASRRGAAYGISGLVKGAGIKSLADNDIIRNLVEASEDKKEPKKREGVSFAFECLSQSLGKFFEPYVIEVLPIILKNLGDQVPEVREATDFAARRIMKNTTSYGVKKLIPLAIENLDEIQWRSKKGSVELLGSMAYLDPTQLSSSLSTIVPEIVGVLNDSHKEVRKAADQALKRFGDVIRNPEIQKLVPVLIKAIGDPTKYTDEALDDLIKTQFVHYIDGPSLALIIHVIHRGMRDRSASTKRKACQIVGNMAILVDSKDLIPYLSTLVTELEVAMVDPVPATRATASRALGSLVEKLGEEQFPHLIPRLLDTLQDESRAGDRLGSAQALAEVISGLGLDKLDELLPTILSCSTSPYAYIRAGFMPLLLFLPVCFGNQFSPYLTRIIPPILAGLADTDESIRDTSLRAGRLVVKNYATKAIDILLPELERGLYDSNYRIRLSSVELTGDLLFQVTGISSKTELTEDQVEFSGEVNKTLVDVLGQDRRDRILASLFVCRSDVSGMVRNASVDIWKALVANTPRTVKEILPTLTSIIVRRLANSDEEQRNIAAQTLGELVRRVGGDALSQLLPTLEESFITSDIDAKQGICIAVYELIKSTQEEAVHEYQSVFLKIIRDALIDPNNTVRESAALAFEALQDSIGKVVIDEIIPYLLNLLESNDSSESALLALQDIMATKSEIIFPILIPTLLAPPVDGFKAKALGSLAVVAGSALYKRLTTIINVLVDTLVNIDDSDEDSQDIKNSFDKILLSVEDDEGLHPLMQQILSLIKHEDVKKRAVIYERLGPFFQETTLDYSIYTPDLVSQFILALDDKTDIVVKNAFEALTALIKNQNKQMLEKLVKPAYQALQITGVKGVDLTGFALPRGPNCILPVFLHGLMYGTTEQREISALSIADIVEKTPAANLKPFVTVITGPLIRVIGERFSSDVKASILYALNMLFAKIPQFLRPFIPQLQRTFVKSLSDPSNETLRSRAAAALGTLIEYQPRVDPLVTELVAGVRNSDDAGVKSAMLTALLEVTSKAGKHMNEASKNSITVLVEEEITTINNDKLAISYAKLLGSLSRILSNDEAFKIIKTKILDRGKDDISGKFAILSLNSFLRESPTHLFQPALIDHIVKFICDFTNSNIAHLSDNATIAIGKILLLHQEKKSPVNRNIEFDSTLELSEDNISKLIRQISLLAVKPPSSSLDTRRLALVVIRTIGRFKYESIIQPNLDIIVLPVFSCVRDIIIPIKLAAEKAYSSIFNLIEDENLSVFNEWIERQSDPILNAIIENKVAKRSVLDYTKRVGVRLAGIERERIAAGGDEETMFSDRFEDEKEIWAVGGVTLSK